MADISFVMKLQAQQHEAKSYLDLIQKLYSTAFCEGDKEGMIETSNDLSLAYAALGQTALAEKWTEEYLQLTLGLDWSRSA
jgi:hypothetical protein